MAQAENIANISEEDINKCGAYAEHLPLIDADIVRVAPENHTDDALNDYPTYVETKSVVYLWFGNKGVTDYGGDDWNDTPYEYNAGHVGDEYVRDIARIALPLGLTAVEPADGYSNSPFCKDDFKAGIAPCVVIVPSSVADLDAAWGDNFYTVCLGNRDAIRVYHGDDLDSILCGIDDLAREHVGGYDGLEVSYCTKVGDSMAMYEFANQDGSF